jgi:nucleotide-binding universal stress UspA family protein
MIERVVVPVDFTDESDRALAVAPALAGRAGARVELITVTRAPDRPGAVTKLAEAADRVGPETTWRVVDSGGPVADALVTELRAGEKELWCVGSHARGALGELIMGSLSERFVREAHAPVVLVGPHVTDAPPGRVLVVALDGTEESEAILPAAAELADTFGMSLRLVQVGRPVVEPMPRDVTETAYLTRVATKVPPMAREAVDYDVLHGDHPAHDLADHVGAHPEVGMVALATRGLSGRERLLHGSTAFELAHRAVVPVAILHQQ